MQIWNFKKMNIWKYEPENESKLVPKISLKFDLSSENWICATETSNTLKKSRWLKPYLIFKIKNVVR